MTGSREEDWNRPDIRLDWEEDSLGENSLPFVLRQRQSAFGLCSTHRGRRIRWVPLSPANHREEDDDWLFSVSAREEVGLDEAANFRRTDGPLKEFHRD